MSNLLKALLIATAQAASRDVANDDDVIMLLVELKQVGLLGGGLIGAPPGGVQANARIRAEGVANALRLRKTRLVHEQDADALLDDGEVRADLVVHDRHLARQRIDLERDLDFAGGA